MAVGAGHDDTPGYERDFVYRALAFYNDELYLRGEDGKLDTVAVPKSAQKSVKREWRGMELREPWEVGGKTEKAGSLIVPCFDTYMHCGGEIGVQFEQTQNTPLRGEAIKQTKQ